MNGLARWQHQAACNTDQTRQIFLASFGQESRDTKLVRDRKRKQICTACPVNMNCYAAARQGPEVPELGYWAGQPEEERAREGHIPANPDRKATILAGRAYKQARRAAQ